MVRLNRVHDDITITKKPGRGMLLGFIGLAEKLGRTKL